MRHRAKGRQLSRTASHKKALMNNMAASLFAHGAITTTTAKAKELRPFAERLITLARRGDLHARRLVERRIKDREILGRLFSEKMIDIRCGHRRVIGIDDHHIRRIHRDGLETRHIDRCRNRADGLRRIASRKRHHCRHTGSVKKSFAHDF